MAFGTIEVLASIVIVISILKLLSFLLVPKKVLNFGSSFFASTQIIPYILLVAALVILYFLHQAGVSIILIFAVFLFTSALVGAFLAPYAPQLIKVMKKHNFVKELWLQLTVWFMLLVWAIITLF